MKMISRGVDLRVQHALGIRPEESLSPEQLDRELWLTERGESDGRKDRPGTDAESLNDVEIAVVRRVEGALAQKIQGIIGGWFHRGVPIAAGGFGDAGQRTADHSHTVSRPQGAR